MENLTPAMRQYMDVKNKNPDCLVLFRMGDFYETFYDDAVEASKVLGITLTSRGKGEKKAPLAGIPYHALNSYLQKLIKHNIKVAIVEQTEDPKKAKGLVKRDLIRIITPGTVVEEDFLEGTKSNYLLSVSRSKDVFGISYIDISTGEFRATEIASEERFLTEVAKIGPSEILIASNDEAAAGVLRETGYYVTLRPVHSFFIENAKENLCHHLGVQDTAAFGLKKKGKAVESAGALVSYLRETQKTSLSYINSIRYYEIGSYMNLDNSTIRNLELTANILDSSGKGTLFSVLNETVTSAGARQLKRWLIRPLIDKEKIRERYDGIEALKDDSMTRVEVRDHLKNTYDIERLISKVSFGNSNPKDLLALKSSLVKVPEIKDLLSSKGGILGSLSDMPDVSGTVELIGKAIKEEPNVVLREGNIIKRGFSNELDELHEIRRNGRTIISDMERKEIEKTGIKSLKIRYNRVFGYFIEVTKKNLDLVPDNYIRKQTQVNSERFITQELKEIEEKIMNAEERIAELEYDLFMDIVSKIDERTQDIQIIARNLSVIDVLSGLSEIASKRDYVKPEIKQEYGLEITEGRHPVVERMVDDFVANGCSIDKNNRIMIITGPNMSGKSTFMRQNALLVLMAQIGSFVPASFMSYSVVDRIFSRVGAYDDLSHGQSTFMVEMTETANILNNATEKSLIILDEIGRGTSTFDGVAIAWSVVEDINNRIGAMTLFATHYHVLNLLEKDFSQIRNFNLAVLEEKNKIVFLRKISKGATDKSYGIHVAEIAGLPKSVIKRAKQIQMNLEGRDKMTKRVKGKKVSEQYDLGAWR